MVDSFFDITYRISRSVDDTGALLKVSNIGSSGEDGVRIHSDSVSSSITLRDGGVDLGSLSTDGSASSLSLGDLDADGRLDVVASSSSCDLDVFFKDPFGTSGVSLSSSGGSGGGGRIALVNEPAGQIPIEIVALSLVSTEPIIVVRKPDALPTDPPVMEYFYDTLDRLTLTMRDFEPAPGESTKTSTDGYHVFDGPSEFSLDTRGLYFADPTGPVFTVTPAGELSLSGGALLAQNSGTGVGIGSLGPGFKLWVDGDICATGLIGPCSDIRYKKNIDTIEDAVERVKNMRGVRFDWRKDQYPEKNFSDKRQLGMIAQEVLEVAPEAVYRDNEGFYSVDYSRLVPILVEAVKEQQKTIESLQNRLDENDKLKAELSELKSIVQKIVSDQGKEKNEATAKTAAY